MAPKATVSNKMVRYGAPWRSRITALLWSLEGATLVSRQTGELMFYTSPGCRRGQIPCRIIALKWIHTMHWAHITHLQSFFSCPNNCFEILLIWEMNDTLLNRSTGEKNMVWVSWSPSMCPFGVSNGGRPPGGDRDTLVYFIYWVKVQKKFWRERGRQRCPDWPLVNSKHRDLKPFQIGSVQHVLRSVTWSVLTHLLALTCAAPAVGAVHHTWCRTRMEEDEAPGPKCQEIDEV